jgi:Mg-chelatase subunit ChlD
MSAMDPPPLVYLVIDTSGSTVRNGFGQACNQALPGVVAALEECCGPSARLGLIAYGTAARCLVPLTPVADLEIIPALRPAGLSSVAAGLRLLATTLATDRHQLGADGVSAGGTLAVLVTDGLPTDPGGDVLAARDRLAAVSPVPPRLHVTVPPGIDALAIAGLGGTVHPLAGTGPAEVAASLVAAVRAAVTGRSA